MGKRRPRRDRSRVAGVKAGTSFDDIIEREGAPIVPTPDDVEREPRTIGVSELVRRVRSLRAHAGYVVRECNELLADLGADDVSNVLRAVHSTFDGVGRAVASSRVDAGENDTGTFDEQDRHERRSSRGTKRK